MRPRSALPPEERRARSRLAKLAHQEPLLRGSLVHMARTCGKPRCRCTRGEKHESLYLAVRDHGKRRLIYVPPDWEERVRQWVAAGQEVQSLIEAITAATLDRLHRGKAERRS